MEDKHRDILRDHGPNIIRDLEPNNILPDLGRVLNEKDEAEIKAQSTRQERCVTLLQILPRKGPLAFAAFVAALKKEAYHLAVELIEEEGRTEHDRCDATEHSEKLRGEIHQLKTELEAEKQDHIKTSQELEELKSRHEISKAHTLELADLVQQLRDVRHYAERENQSWEKEIQEWKTKSEKYEQENQALQKSLGSAMEKQERLEVLSSDLERANKAQREQIRQLQRMNEELQDKVTNERVLKTPVEIVQQHTGE